MEIWKEIPDYEGLYEVSDLGQVRRVNAYNSGKCRLLKPELMKDNYLLVSLSKKGKVKKFLVHRLVAKTFITNPENKPEVNHKKGIKADNRATELEWCTKSENERHAWKTGLKNSYWNRKSVFQSKDERLIKKWESQAIAARELGISQGCISKCCLGALKTYRGFNWNFAT